MCERLAFLTGTSLPPRLETLDDIFRSMSVSIEVCGKRLARGRQNRNELKETREELERVDAIKNQFIRRVSHELRTPLASIDGFAKTLLRVEQGEEESPEGNSTPITSEMRREFLSIISKEVNRLEEMIESVINLSAIESTNERPCSQFTVRELCGSAISSMEMGKYRSVVSLRLQPAPDGPVLRADRQGMVEVLRQLLNNAQKYSAGQEVVLGAEHVSIGPPCGSQGAYGALVTPAVRLFVRDSGIGIPQSELPRIFEKLYRIERTAAAFPGVGLGLSIVRALVNQSNGHVWAESEVGRGSTFFVLLPNQPVDA